MLAVICKPDVMYKYVCVFIVCVCSVCGDIIAVSDDITSLLIMCENLFPD